MQVAALLSDLKSLSVCSHAAALNLVNVHKHLDNAGTTHDDIETSGNDKSKLSDDSTQRQSQSHLQSERDASTSNSDPDPDLKRANDLVSLHYAAKIKHQESGLDKELLHARRVVGGVLTSLAQRQR